EPQQLGKQAPADALALMRRVDVDLGDLEVVAHEHRLTGVRPAGLAEAAADLAVPPQIGGTEVTVGQPEEGAVFEGGECGEPGLDYLVAPDLDPACADGRVV